MSTTPTNSCRDRRQAPGPAFRAGRLWRDEETADRREHAELSGVVVRAGGRVARVRPVAGRSAEPWPLAHFDALSPSKAIGRHDEDGEMLTTMISRSYYAYRMTIF